MTTIPSEFRSRRFYGKVATNSLAVLGGIATLAGLADVFWPGILAPLEWVPWIAVLVALGAGVYLAWPQPIENTYSSPRTTIRIIAGDMFDLSASDEHLIIGVSDSFDTTEPMIASTSLQGQFLLKVYRNNSDQLNAAISEALKPYSDQAKPIPDKVNGNKLAYPIGTTAVLQAPGRTAFLIAYTRMDHEDHVSTTVDLVWESLTKLWERVRARGNSATVRMGVVGGGNANLSSTLPAMDAIRFQILSFVLASRSERVCDGLNIVVRRSEYELLDHAALQDFLKSLG